MLTRNDLSEVMIELVKNKTDYLNVIWAIEEFNLAFNVKPNPELYANLVVEETNEWVEELTNNGYTENLLKETIDIIYVLEGLLASNPEETINITDRTLAKLEEALQLIYDVVLPISELYFEEEEELIEAFLEVHNSNMSKLGEDGKPILREGDNKVLKGPNYAPPNLAELVLEKSHMVKALRITGYE